MPPYNLSVFAPSFEDWSNCIVPVKAAYSARFSAAVRRIWEFVGRGSLQYGGSYELAPSFEPNPDKLLAMFLLAAILPRTAFRRVALGLAGLAVALGAAGKLRAQADGSVRWPGGFKTGSTSQLPYIDSSPAVGSDGTIYIGVGFETTPKGGAVIAIDRNGIQKGKQFTAPQPVESSPIVAPDGTIYVGCRDGNLYALNPDLTVKWAFPADGDSFIYSSPTIGSDGTIYFGSADIQDFPNSALYALTPDGKLRWRQTMGDWVESSPAIGADGTIYVGSWDDNIYAFAPDGTEKWHVTTSAPVISSAAIAADGTVYIGSNDGLLYALSPDGQTKWTFATGEAIVASPVIGADGTIYVGSVDSNFYALNPGGPAESRQKWKIGTQGQKQIQSTAAVRSDGSIIVGDQGGYIRALNPDDGSVRWAYQTGGQVNSSPVVAADGSVYVGSLDGKLYAFNGTAPLSAFASWPMFQRNATHSGRVHDASTNGQFMSLSTRAQVEPGKNLIAGFVVGGNGNKALLLRGIGPTLTGFGVANPLADPTLTYNSFPSGFTLQFNDNWVPEDDVGNNIVDISKAVGAFSLPPGSKDAVVYAATVLPGAYTAILGSADGGAGVALVEMYDAAANRPDARLTGISNRGLVGTGDNVLIAGLAIGGNGPLRVLVRAVGPGLAAYGVAGALTQPVLAVYSLQTVIRRNVGWTSDGYKADLVAATQAVGDFPLADGSADCAVLITLDRGAYTIQVSGVGGTTGVALVEVYAVP
jgi:outer membrane protein assembly factor BamB